MNEQNPIVFYDGSCGLCNGWVIYLAKHDRRRILRFAPLQGITARQLIAKVSRTADLESVVFWANGQTWERSEAVLRALECCGAIRRVFARIARFFPLGLRDGFYRWVARNRKRWFGTRSCDLLVGLDERFLP